MMRVRMLIRMFLAQPVQNRQRERGRLARARLGGPEQVAAVKDMWDRLRLDGRGRVITLLVERTEEGLGEPQGIELHLSCVPLLVNACVLRTRKGHEAERATKQAGRCAVDNWLCFT